MPFPSSWNIAIAAGFIVGLLLFVVSSAMLRADRRDTRASAAAWPKLVDETLENVDAELRLDMVERLSVLPGEWSRGILAQARIEETDAAIRAAIDRALGASG